MIQSEPENIEQIRERLRKMSDLELRKYGRAARDLANPKEEPRKAKSPVSGSIWTTRRRNGAGGIRSNIGA
jgi:hypothetical protein